MNWIVNNWSLLVVILFGVTVISINLKKFGELPSEAQISKVKEWLLWAVIEAEKQYSTGTGALKLRATYSQFCQIFPSLVPVISFELFSKLVDEALVQMRHLLETNKDIEAYVNEDNV